MRPATGAPRGDHGACGIRSSLALLAAGALALLAAGCAGQAPAPAQPAPTAPPPAARPGGGGAPGTGPAAGAPGTAGQPQAPGAAAAGEAFGRTGWLDVGVVLDAAEVRVTAELPEPVVGLAGTRELEAGGTLVVWLEGGRAVASRAREGGGRDGRTAATVADTLFVGGPASESVLVNGRRYRGGAKLFLSPRGKLTVANRVSVEAYLRGVLPHEIGRLEAVTLEAGKAQAVAARTYTLSYVGRRADEGFDLYDSVEDQVYGGTDHESEWTDRAVRETAGVVALYDGHYIRANYHSTCGGATVNVEDIWPDPPFPWLRQVEDGSIDHPWCAGSKHFRWVERWSGAEVLSNLNRYGPEQSGVSPPAGGWKQLRDVRVASRTPSGRVRELVFTTEAGDIVVMADKTRWVLRRPAATGGGILRSSLFKVGVRKDRKGRVTEVVASGGGNGHGAGMCQVGALAQSRAGRGYEAILRIYYTGIDLVQVEGLDGMGVAPGAGGGVR